MAIRVTEEKGYEQSTFQWDKISLSLEPEIQNLTDKSDRDYFTSKVKFLIGKDIKLSNFKNEAQYYYFIYFAIFIDTLMRYPMLVYPEYIRSQITLFLNQHGELLSMDALAWKYGPMGFQQQKVIQEVLGEKKE